MHDGPRRGSEQPTYPRIPLHTVTAHQDFTNTQSGYLCLLGVQLLVQLLKLQLSSFEVPLQLLPVLLQAFHLPGTAGVSPPAHTTDAHCPQANRHVVWSYTHAANWQ